MGQHQPDGVRYEGRHFRRRRRRVPVWAAVGTAAVVVAGIGLSVGASRATYRAHPTAVAPAAASPVSRATPSSLRGASPSSLRRAATSPVSLAATPSLASGPGSGGAAPSLPGSGAAGVDLTAVGPHGVTSQAIIAENAKPGTTAWQLLPEPATGYIEGFADTTYAAVGQTVTIYVSTSAPRFSVFAYRMGWYGGLGGREIWSSPSVAGVQQPDCPVDHTTNMVSCDDWAESLTMPVTAAFVQGDYMLKLVGSGGEESYILLTIWDPNSTAAYLVMGRSLTEEGWNTYGGYSYYQGRGPCILGQTGSYPVCNRARVVSFDRPDDTNHGASDFLSNEFPLVQLMERDGLDAAYVSDITVDEHPAIILAHRAVLSLGHDETWTYNERKAAQAGFAKGVNFFFGAAAVLRHSRLEPSTLGPDRQEVDYRDSTEDPLYRQGGDPGEVTGNTWASPPTSWSEVPFVGQEYSGYLYGADTVPLVVSDASSWVYQGTGLQDGSEVPGVVASDFDHLDPGGGSPGTVDVLGHSPVPLTEAFTTQGTWGGQTYSDMTYYSDPTTQAGVFDAGTVNWIYALTPCAASVPGGQEGCGAATVATITENVLRVFGAGPAGRTEPSTGNWTAIRPYGS